MSYNWNSCESNYREGRLRGAGTRSKRRCVKSSEQMLTMGGASISVREGRGRDGLAKKGTSLGNGTRGAGGVVSGVTHSYWSSTSTSKLCV